MDPYVDQRKVNNASKGPFHNISFCLNYRPILILFYTYVLVVVSWNLDHIYIVSLLLKTSLSSQWRWYSSRLWHLVSVKGKKGEGIHRCLSFIQIHTPPHYDFRSRGAASDDPLMVAWKSELRWIQGERVQRWINDIWHGNVRGNSCVCVKCFALNKLNNYHVLWLEL